jgi:pyruvate formate lyase activating enzyme
MKQIKKMCLWIKKNLGPDTPIHFTRFYPMYKLTKLPPTPIKTLERAREVAIMCGLNYVYIGNVSGHKYENTFCPKCKKLLIKRIGYEILEINIKKGSCKFCGNKIPGIW